MAYIPEIVDYKPFFIQTESDSAARNTTEWGLIAKTNPFPLLPNPKDPYKNDWHDANGDEEWVEKIYYQPIEFEVSFYIKAYETNDESAEVIMRRQIDGFFSLIKAGEFKIYDSYNGIGRRKVRYAGYSEEDFSKRSNWARAIFRIKFKVNDPITRMVISNNSIVEE